jgi:hypothetical protein
LEILSDAENSEVKLVENENGIARISKIIDVEKLLLTVI